MDSEGRVVVVYGASGLLGIFFLISDFVYFVKFSVVLLHTHTHTHTQEPANFFTFLEYTTQNYRKFHGKLPNCNTTLDSCHALHSTTMVW